MKVLVAGGTGLLGTAITEAAIAAGHDVTVLSRSARQSDLPDARASVARGDVLAPATLLPALSGMDVVVDAVQFPGSPIENKRKGYTFERVDLGGTKNLVDAAKEAGVRQFIGLSGVGAAADGEYFWLRYKWQEEEHIRASGLPFTIFRPSWIYGPQDVALNRFLGFARFLPFVPVIGNGKGRLNPLFVKDLGAHVVAAAGNDGALNRVFEIGGPEILTMDDILRTALRVSGKRRFLFHSPKGLVKLSAWFAQYLPGPPITPDAVDFITMAAVADTTDLSAVFGLRLTPLEEALGTYLRK